MKNILSMFLMFSIMGCVQEIPLEELENESFVESGQVVKPVPVPAPIPIPEVVKTPTLIQITPKAAEYVAGTKSIEVKVITDINAHCRYIEGAAGFNVMTPMTQTNGVEHKQTISGLNDGDEKRYQFKCAQKADSTSGFAFKYVDIVVSKNIASVLPDNPPTPEITSLKFLGGVYILEWKVDTSTALGSPDGGFDTILNGVDTADRTAAISFAREYQNLDHNQKQCFQIEARWAEYNPIKGRVSSEVCLDPQMNAGTVAPPSAGNIEQLRASVRQIFDTSCISCHAPGKSQARLLDLTVDLKVLEKNAKYVTLQNPEASYLYKKILTGTMNKYLPLAADQQVIYNWIKTADGKEEIILNCAADEAPLDNQCVKVGKVVRSYGFRMVTPSEMFSDINGTFKVNLENKDPITGMNIIPEPHAKHGFSNQFGLIATNSVFVSRVNDIAEILGNVLMTKDDFDTKVVDCMAESLSNCGMKLAKDYIPKLFRRDISDAELGIYKTFFENAVGTKREVYIAFFQALIQSPSFIFRQEHGALKVPYFGLDPYEVASRLSYFVMGSAPDMELMQAARDGSIMQKSVRIAHAERLMTKYVYKSNSHLAKVFLESIGIKRQDLSHPDAISDDMYRETIWVTRDVFFNFEQKWTNIFSNKYTYVNQRLADIYDFNVNTNGDWIQVQYPDNKRLGILSHASYLASNYEGTDIEDTNEIRRGINFYEKILCRSLSLPPADVDVDIDPSKDLTGCNVENRKNSTLSPTKSCFQCHQHFDRIGLGFERFNNLGEYREVEKERPSCSTIEDFYLDGATRFSTMPEFAQAVGGNDDVGRCLALKMKSYAYGTDVSFDHLKSIYLEMDTFKNTMKFKDLIKDIVANDEFVMRKGE